MSDGGPRQYPLRVPDDEVPPKTVDRLPSSLVEKLLQYAEYIECPACGSRQWEMYISGDNNHIRCNTCEHEMTIVG